MKILILLLSSTLLFSCAKPKPQIIYQTIEVEKVAYQIPKFEIPPKPVLAVDLLTAENQGDYNTIGKAYVSSLKVLENLVDQMYNLLEGIKADSVK